MISHAHSRNHRGYLVTLTSNCPVNTAGGKAATSSFNSPYLNFNIPWEETTMNIYLLRTILCRQPVCPLFPICPGLRDQVDSHRFPSSSNAKTPRKPFEQHTAALKVVLLPARSGILVEVPLHISVLVFQRTAPNFEGLHGHPGSDFRQLDTLV